MKRALGLSMFVVLALGLSNCSERLTGPADPSHGVRLELRLSSDTGTPGHAVSAIAIATNGGGVPVYRDAVCSIANGISMRVLDAAGNPVRFAPPNLFELGCPDYCCAPLDPGQHDQRDLTFAGSLYPDPVAPLDPPDPYPAPAGTYTVEATFSAGTRSAGEQTGQSIVLTRRASFTWSTQ